MKARLMMAAGRRVLEEFDADTSTQAGFNRATDRLRALMEARSCRTVGEVARQDPYRPNGVWYMHQLYWWGDHISVRHYFPEGFNRETGETREGETARLEAERAAQLAAGRARFDAAYPSPTTAVQTLRSCAEHDVMSWDEAINLAKLVSI